MASKLNVGEVSADKWTNADGTENYKCRAWVNFNGTGTVAIRASGNISSITDNGVGNYTVNMTTPMPDSNFSWCGTAGPAANGTSSMSLVHTFGTTPTASTIRFQSTNDAGSAFDCSYVNVVIFR